MRFFEVEVQSLEFRRRLLEDISFYSTLTQILNIVMYFISDASLIAADK